MTKTWPTLFKKASTGKIVQWTVSVNENIISTVWGQVGGELQTTTDEIKEGKNVGRANATTPEAQAAAEAEALWTKKLKKDYVKTKAEAEAGASSELIAGGILPMLAKRYDEDGAKIRWPAFAQPKLDGHRCIAMVTSGKCTLWSRTRKQITSMPHIVAAVEALKLKGNVVLDGELYNHDYHDKFEELTSLIRPEDPKPGCEVVHYHIYDTANPTDTFSQRTIFLKQLLKGVPETLHYVETIAVEDEDALMVAFEKFRADGYEGAIVRNSAGLYLNKRSYDLQKVKEFSDGEWPIVGVIEGRGKLAGHGIFVCETKDGMKFEAKMIGKLTELKKFFEHPELAIGKQLTVQYQGLTGKSKVPRFPVALRIHEGL